MTFKPDSRNMSLLVVLAALMAGCAFGQPAWAASQEMKIEQLPPAVLEKADPAVAEEAAPAASNPGPVVLNVEEAVFMALRQNASFRVDSLSPSITQTYETQEEAAFDPTVSATLSQTWLENDPEDLSESMGLEVGLQKQIPAGTAIQAGVSRNPATISAPASNSYDLEITQALLQGRGREVNLVGLRQARLDTAISAYQFRGVAEALVASVEEAYWDNVLAERSIGIYEKSLEIAEQQAEEVRERIKVGKLAETELAAAEAELASRRESLIDARSDLAKSRLALLRLINPGGDRQFSLDLKLTQPPDLNMEEPMADTDSHVALGLKQRADLNQARLALSQDELEVVRTRNGLLPKLGLFLSLGGTQYTESFSVLDADEWNHGLTAGLTFEFPVGNRAAKAEHKRAALALDQAQASLRNMGQLVELGIRTAYVEVERTREKIKATEATRKLREETLNTETEKLRLGKSTTLTVAQASRDLVESQISGVQAVIDFRKAMLALFQAEGSLLERRGIRAGEPTF